jgi:hypothetical protein
MAGYAIGTFLREEYDRLRFDWNLLNSRAGEYATPWEEVGRIETADYHMWTVAASIPRKMLNCTYCSGQECGPEFDDDLSSSFTFSANLIAFGAKQIVQTYACTQIGNVESAFLGPYTVYPEIFGDRKLTLFPGIGGILWERLGGQSFNWQRKITIEVTNILKDGVEIFPPMIRPVLPQREVVPMEPTPEIEPAVPPITPTVPPLVIPGVGTPGKTKDPTILPAIPGVGPGAQPGEGTGTGTGNAPGTALPAVAPPVVKPVPAVPQVLPAVDPLPEPVPEISPQAEYLPGLVKIPATRPPATLKGIATEVGKIEGKLALMLGAEPPVIPGTNVPANWLGKLWEILSNVEPAGSYTISGPCEVDENGDPIVEIRERPWPLALNPFAAIEHRLDALALLLQDHKDLRQPVCKVRGNMQGREVTVNFREVGGSQRRGASAIRKRLSYRCLVTPTIEELQAHWDGFEWEAGPTMVQFSTPNSGIFRVWAADESEGRRVVRHALEQSGFNETDGEWTAAATTNPRYGVAATVVADSGSARIGPSGS